MGILQAWAAHWLTTLVDWLPLGYAFGAGMLAAVNPCGFAMLPAYLALFLGTGIDRTPSVAGGAVAQRGAVAALPAQPALAVWRRLVEALVVGLTVSAGFVALFTVAGLVIAAGGRVLLPIMPWVGLVIGLGLVVLGAALLLGWTVSPGAFERLAARFGQPGTRTLRGFFLFGLSYGLASLSCTLPVFMVAAGSALVSGSLGRGVVQLLSYGLGMASVVVVLTLALALVKTGVVGALRRAVPYVQAASAGLLILAGVAIVLYWWPHLSGV